MGAVDHDDLECVEILLAAGADIAPIAIETAFGRATTAAIARRLLDAGADPQELSFEARRALLGYPNLSGGDDDRSAGGVTGACSRPLARAIPSESRSRSGRHDPIWDSGLRPAFEKVAHGAEHPFVRQRFGQSLTLLPDGRIVQSAASTRTTTRRTSASTTTSSCTAGRLDGDLRLPRSVFPPTDFHTATLVGDDIYMVGSLGYLGTRRYGETPVYRWTSPRCGWNGWPPAEGTRWLSLAPGHADCPAADSGLGGQGRKTGRWKRKPTPDNAGTFVLDAAMPGVAAGAATWIV